MKTITLIGMMGSGKTSIGNLLSKRLNIPLVDIDSEIELNEGLKISDIFAQKGEEYFRTIEAETIKNTFSAQNLIISTGGGAFENLQTREFLLKNSTVIYLETSPETIFERIKNNNDRPLLKNNMTVEKITGIIQNREQNYKLAHHTILTDNKEPAKIVQGILGVL